MGSIDAAAKQDARDFSNRETETSADSVTSDLEKAIRDAGGDPSQIPGISEKSEEQKQKEKTLQKQRLIDQSYLLLNIENISKLGKSEYVNRTKIQDQFARIEHDKPYELNNILFSVKPKYDVLINSTNLDLSVLVPKIRIFKEYKVDNESKLIEFPFEDHTNPEDFGSMLSDRAGRGSGVGIKYFSWTTIGTNTASKYAFTSELELFFQNIEDLDTVRRVDYLKNTNKKIETRFSDLIMTNAMYTKSNNDGPAIYNPDYFRIKVMVGWQVPKVIEGVSREFLDEISANNLSLYMSLIDHKITINDDGTIKLVINYTSYVESLMSFPKDSNILILENENKIAALNEQYEELGSEYNEAHESRKEGLKKEQENIKKQIDAVTKSNIQERYSKFISALAEKNLIKTIYASPDELNFIQELPRYYKMTDTEIVSSLSNQVGRIRDAALEQIQLNDSPQQSLMPETPPDENQEMSMNVPNNNGSETIDQAFSEGTNKQINYFFIGDLLQVVLKDMFLSENVQTTDFKNKKIKIMLGPLYIYDYGQLTDAGLLVKTPGQADISNSSNVRLYVGKETPINIADIPVSLETFQAWFNTNITDKGLIVFTLKDFVESILNDLVIRLLANETYSFAPRQKARLVYKPFSIPANSSRFDEPIEKDLYHYDAIKFSDKPFRDTSGTVSDKQTIENYILIYGYGENSFDLKSDYEADLKKGIRHLFYGAEKGLVKNITFNKIDDPLLRKHNLRLSVENGGVGSRFLRGVYNATVEMFGNTIFDIGQVIYIAPTFYGSSKVGDRVKFVKDLGIGGYYNCIKIKNSIAEGKFDTTLDLMWQARGDGSQSINEFAIKIPESQPK